MENCDTIIGIDPGAGGGIAHFRDGRITAVRMPMESTGMQDYLNYLRSFSIRPIVFIEKLQYRPSDRNIPGRDYQIAKMLKHYEKLITTMELMPGLMIVETHPITWQSYLHLKIKKKDGEPEETHDDRKRRYRVAAQAYYPSAKATLWNCDAILLIEFGRRKLIYDPEWIEGAVKRTAMLNRKADLF